MADYSADIVSARKDITEAGIMCKWRRDDAGDFDCPILFDRFDPRVIDGDLIRPNDYMAWCPGDLARKPDPEFDKLVVPPCDVFPNGETLRLVRAMPTAPSLQDIIWELQLRK